MQKRVGPKVKCVCAECGCNFERERSQVNRSKKQGKNIFCSLSCSCSHGNKNASRNRVTAHLEPANQRDELTPFRWFLARARQRWKRWGVPDLSLEDLKEIWDKQQGICPLSGWAMELPQSTRGFGKSKNIRRASVDRIDPAIGYTKNNIRFTCVIANYCRNQFDDNEVIQFCNQVAKYNKAKEE